MAGEVAEGGRFMQSFSGVAIKRVGEAGGWISVTSATRLAEEGDAPTRNHFNRASCLRRHSDRQSPTTTRLVKHKRCMVPSNLQGLRPDDLVPFLYSF
ncbi:hypothetical protein Trco_006234 [Trichoderma cornu-damae]|uniref:Uncharacterized protein n=1 Tax=Trichoderma cornu-damae TaxID=654480 RepID=A0A9P8QLG2_9HYPO|nr:hypothetical protein Trco_006234 [Trichoderma cornu-damae]